MAGVPAWTAADLVDLNRWTAIHFYHRLPLIIAQQIEEEWAFSGGIKVDESDFGGRRKGKQGRGAAGKVPVFGILQRGGKVYTKVIPDAKSQTLLPSSARRSSLIVLSILTIIVPTMPWTYLSLSTIALTIASCLRTNITTSMALKTFGIKPSGICVNTMAFPSTTFPCS